MTTATTPQLAALDERSFRTAFEQHGATVLRYVRARLGEQLAEDVTSETFVAAWRARASFDPQRGLSIEAWLLGVATHVIARHRRSEARWLRMTTDARHVTPDRSSIDAQLDAVDRRVSTTDQRRRLTRAIRRLPHAQRDPLLLHVLGELSYEEIAAALDLPLGTVKSRINRARQRLQQVMT